MLALAFPALLIAACGNVSTNPRPAAVAHSPSAGTANSAAPSTAPPVAGLFALLETRRTGVAQYDHGTPDTIVIASPDGYARAKVSFKPRTRPDVPMAGAVLAVPAHTAAGGVYFIDGSGVVRRLDPSGSVRTVTTFPITSGQQAVSFAVSPDGKNLMAAVLTYPSVAPGPSGGPPFEQTGPTKLDLERAIDGGNATAIGHWQGAVVHGDPSQPQFHNLTMAGWDGIGPMVVVDAYPAIQQEVIEGQQWAGGSLARMNLDGSVGRTLTPSDCTPFSVDQSGTILCAQTEGSGPLKLDVISGSGQLLWQAAISTTAPYGFPGGYAVSPDGSHVAMDGQVSARDGARISLAANFATRGWLDDQTIIGFIGGSNDARIGIVRLAAPARPEDWGFTGQFVGRISAGAA